MTVAEVDTAALAAANAALAAANAALDAERQRLRNEALSAAERLRNSRSARTMRRVKQALRRCRVSIYVAARNRNVASAQSTAVSDAD